MLFLICLERGAVLLYHFDSYNIIYYVLYIILNFDYCNITIHNILHCTVVMKFSYINAVVVTDMAVQPTRTLSSTKTTSTAASTEKPSLPSQTPTSPPSSATSHTNSVATTVEPTLGTETDDSRQNYLSATTLLVSLLASLFVDSLL